MKTHLITALLSIALLLTACSPAPHTADAAPPTKADALKIITSMGFQNVDVAAVIQGVGIGQGFGSGNSVATVIEYAEQNGQFQRSELTIYYDKDLGWFYYETDIANKRVRLWTTTGYSEVHPAK